jgi:hypothetical protein
MSVVSHIYARIEGTEQMYHIAEITYEAGDFGTVSTREEGIAMVTGSIMDMFDQIDGMGLQRVAQSQDSDGDPGTGDVQQ